MKSVLTSAIMHIKCTSNNPPPGLIWQVNRSLRWIKHDDLIGINSLHIMDEIPVDKRYLKTGRVQGFYHFSTSQEPAKIMLSTREIYRGVPSILWWTTIPTLRLGRALAHEVAHHLVATRGYVFVPGDAEGNEESVADRYAESILEKMVKRWQYKLGKLCTKEIASWHYSFGLADARKDDYSSAANHFLTAWDLDPDHEEAADSYRRAREYITNIGAE